MSRTLRITLVVAAGMIGLCGVQFGDVRPGDSGISIVREAGAVIGRPLTPVSVAGVARRTVRRCAVGVYHC
jgi:hypothetical protein